MLCPFVNTGFQVLFHSPPGVLFTFPSRYCSSIGHQVVFSLGGWSPLLPTGFLVSCGTLDTAHNIYLFRLRDFYPLWSDFPVMFRSRSYHFLLSTTPYLRRHMVWALPRSLAATRRIVFTFSSSGYLDVSVPRVPLIYLCIQYMITDLSSAEFPHSDIHGSLPVCGSPWLFAACHVLLRLLMPRHSPCALIRLINVSLRLPLAF